MDELALKADGIISTIDRLSLRITDRFPGSGLAGVCARLHNISRETEKTVTWISTPIYTLRVISFLAIVGLVGLVAWIVYYVGITELPEFLDLLSATESSLNLLILLSVVVVFIWSWELRIKRRRVLKSINRLRDVAHVVDMHQLTKDPDGVSNVSAPTRHSPKRTLTLYETGRYLDYCTELLSLISKLGYLYVTLLDDDVATNAANELETHTTGMSRKIWQKIIILKSMQQGGTAIVPK